MKQFAIVAVRIYCPKCEWVPAPRDRWMCIPGCHMVWNTFETRARCPGCSTQWRVTQCLACHAVSPHEDWYHDEWNDSDADEHSRDREEELVGVSSRAGLLGKARTSDAAGAVASSLRSRAATSP
jgi:hypothetical protein